MFRYGDIYHEIHDSKYSKMCMGACHYLILNPGRKQFRGGALGEASPEAGHVRVASAAEELRQAQHPHQPLHAAAARRLASQAGHSELRQVRVHLPRQARQPQLTRGRRMDQEDSQGREDWSQWHT